MGLTSFITGFIAPIFIIVSPITSYADQIFAMHRNKSSAGFSMDIPLIMLVASIFRVFYYPGAKYDVSLLIQAVIMIGMQVILLKVALDHRPPPSSKGGESSLPFVAAREGEFGVSRPYNFWQWRSPKPYWEFLLYIFLILLACELLFAPFPQLYAIYSNIVGYTGLAVEAMLPVPQILANARSQSCKGFRLSVLASWLAGDFMKMFWFFNATTTISLPFKLCGIFQACCDGFLGAQFFVYGAGDKTSKGQFLRPNGVPSRPPSTVSIPMVEKDSRLE